MVDHNEARALAGKSTTLREGISLGDAVELREGWFFPLITQLAGCNGIIVNKGSGKLLHLGSAFPVARDLELYDRGYQFETYDLVITRIADSRETLDALRRLGLLAVIEARLGRKMKMSDLDDKRRNLPWVLPALSLYASIEALEQVREDGWFTFELREHVAQ